MGGGRGGDNQIVCTGYGIYPWVQEHDALCYFQVSIVSQTKLYTEVQPYYKNIFRSVLCRGTTIRVFLNV